MSTINHASKLPKILTTAQAAAVLCRNPQTLRKWSCTDTGPIKPVKINGRLGWRVEDVRRLLAG